LHLDFVKQYCQISNVGLASTYLACLVNTYAVRGRTKYCAGVLGQLRGRAAAQPRSLEGTLTLTFANININQLCKTIRILQLFNKFHYYSSKFA